MKRPRSPDPSRRPVGQSSGLGWREWVHFPDLGGVVVKAKLDTGARTSALHAFDIERFERDGRELVRFVVHPEQRTNKRACTVEAEVRDVRTVRSSSGHSEERIVIRTPIAIAGVRFAIDLSLTRRDEMGFRLLLGREALRRRFVVDPARSFLAGVPGRKTTRSPRRRP